MATDNLANVQVPLQTKHETFTVATVPDATTQKGMRIIVSNGHAGTACYAVSDGTNWLVDGDVGSTAIAAS